MSLALRLLAASAAALLLAGCGGQGSLDRKALGQEAKTPQALAAEGGLLAGNAARGSPGRARAAHCGGGWRRS